MNASHKDRRAIFAVWNNGRGPLRLWLHPGGWDSVGRSALYLPTSARDQADHWSQAAGILRAGTVRPHSLLLRASGMNAGGPYRTSPRAWRRRRLYQLGRAA